MEYTLPLRITLTGAPAGVLFCLQRGRDERVGAQLGSGADLHFELEVRAQPRADGSLNLLGPYAQGPSAARFVYLGVGTYAGQTGTPWSRRIKVPLSGITAALVGLNEQAAGSGQPAAGSGRPAAGRGGRQPDRPGSAGVAPATLPRVSARISGTGKDGTPACASVKLLGDGWQRG